MKTINIVVETAIAAILAVAVVAVVILMMMVIGCTNPIDKSTNYENARRATVDAWEEVIGRVSDKCYQRSIDALVTETGRFPESCIPLLEYGEYIGCYMPTKIFGMDGDMIFIYDGRTEIQRLDTAVHEYAHLLHFCETGGDKLDLALFITLLTECAAQLIDGGEPDDRCLMPGDYFHLDDRMWDDYGSNTVEAIGCTNLEL